MAEPPFSRSPLLMNRDDSALLIIDVQERLVPHIQNHQRVVWQIERLVRGANILGVPVLATEQYPKGLGATVPQLQKHFPDSLPEKKMFSCRECRQIGDFLEQHRVQNLVLAGIETHVCVQQTAFDFLSMGWNIFLAVDAVGSRFDQDRDIAVRRMENSGVVLSTTESILFEWCEIAGSEEFKQISRLAQETLSHESTATKEPGSSQ